MKRKIAVCANGWSLDALADALEGFKACAKERDFDVFVFLSFASYSVHHALMRGELNIYQQIEPSDYDGIVIFSTMLNSDETVYSLCEKAKEQKVPVVSIGMKIKGVPMVSVGNENGMRAIVRHLIEEHQVKKVFYIGGTEDHPDSNERLRAAREEMEAHGLKLPDRNVGYGKWSNRRAIDALDELVKQHKKYPDAILCANDIMALAICTELEKRGIRVPEDVRVTGFDNTRNAGIFYPAITTVRADYASVARRSCEIIYADKKNRGGRNIKIVVPTIPVIAESCGCVDDPGCSANRKMYCKHTFQRDINEKLLEQNERVLRERIADVSDYQDMKNKLRYHYLGNHQFEGSAFYMILNDEYFKNVLSAENAHGNDCLSGNLDVAVALKDGKLLEVERVSAERLIPEYRKKKNEQHVFFLSPLHYYDHNYGYIVFTDSPYVLNDGMVYTYMEKLMQSLRLLRVNLRLKLLYDKDALTGLYNRLGYENKVLPLYQESVEKKTKLTVFFVDINYMKTINDNFGHEQGDVAIKTVALSISDCMQKDWAAVRYGGDEFLVIAPNCATQKAATVKKRIEERLAERIREAELPYSLTVSIGYVTTDPVKRADAKLKDYVREADDLMYVIKKAVHSHDDKADTIRR